MTATPLPGGSYRLGDTIVTRFGYGAMQLAGPGVMGPPADPAAALGVLRDVVDAGITHIDTSGAYGPQVTNELVREALGSAWPSVVVATKVGADRDPQGGWPVARRPEDIRRQVEENLRSLGVDVLDVVNLRMGDAFGPAPGPLGEAFGALVALQEEGLVRHVGVSNVTAEQVDEARQVGEVACVQNMYNLAHRADDELVDRLAADGIAYVPFFPLGGFTPLQSQALTAVAARRSSSPMSVALAWLLQRSPNILLIPGTASSEHLRQNIDGAAIELSDADLEDLDHIGPAGLVR